MRGWQLLVSDDTGGAGETTTLLTLTQHPVHLVRPARRHHHHGLRGSGRRHQLRSDSGRLVDQRPGGRRRLGRLHHSPELLRLEHQHTDHDLRRWRRTRLRPGGRGGRASERRRQHRGVQAGGGSRAPISRRSRTTTTAAPAASEHPTSSTPAPRSRTSRSCAPRSASRTLDCDDANVCNGVETCDIPSATCLPGTCGASQVVLLDDDFESDLRKLEQRRRGRHRLDAGQRRHALERRPVRWWITRPAAARASISTPRRPANGTGYPDKTALLQSPCIDLNGAIDATLTFWYHMVGVEHG